MARSERAGGVDEIPGPEREALAAHDAGDGRPGDEPDDHRGVEEARSEERHHDEDEEQRRDRHEHVGDAHDAGVHRAAEVAGGAAHGGADQDREARREESDLERHAGAPDHPGQDVPPEPVGAEPVGGGRRLEPLEERLGGVAVGRDGRRQDAGREHRRDHEPPQEAPPVPGDPPEPAHE